MILKKFWWIYVIYKSLEEYVIIEIEIIIGLKS